MELAGVITGTIKLLIGIGVVIGLIVGNLLHPGSGLHITASIAKHSQSQVTASQNTMEFLLGIIATTLVSAFTSSHIRQILLVAMLGGFALQNSAPRASPSAAVSSTRSTR